MTTNRTPGWACYLRLSDEDKQHPEFTLPGQRRNIRERLLDHSDLPVYRWYEDRLSGRDANRPGYQQMMRDARAGKFSHIALSTADRFGRDVAIAAGAIKELMELGVVVKFADMPQVELTTPDGFFLAGLRICLAQRESDMIGVRVKDGMTSKILDGDWPFLPPDGYLNAEEKLPGGKYRRWIETDPDRFPVVQEARREFATGKYTMVELCQLLHDRGYERAGGRPWVINRGEAKQALHRILTNEFYAGWLVVEKWGLRVRGNHEPTDDDETHARIQQILRSHDCGRVRRRRHFYLLPSVLWSQEGNCRFYTMHAKGHGGEYAYYYTKRKVDGKQLYIQCQTVDAQIPDVLATLTIAEDAIPEIRQAYAAEVFERIERERAQREAALKRRVTQLEGEELRLGRQLIQGRISEEAYDELAGEWKGKLIAARAQLQQLRRDAGSRITDLDRALGLFLIAPAIYAEGALEQRDKRSLIEILIERIVVNREGEIVEATLNPPFAYLNHLRFKSRPVRHPTQDPFRTPLPPPAGDLAAISFPARDILIKTPALMGPVDAVALTLRA